VGIGSSRHCHDPLTPEGNVWGLARPAFRLVCLSCGSPSCDGGSGGTFNGSRSDEEESDGEGEYDDDEDYNSEEDVKDPRSQTQQRLRGKAEELYYYKTLRGAAAHQPPQCMQSSSA
jgi:hypothetical protein